jgi:hypothetical protein
VIRHGLDMAFSHNQNQLNLWGPRYGVAPPTTPAEAPTASLQYWLRANITAIDIAQKRLPDRHLVINYDRLCVAPTETIDELAHFLDLPASVDRTRLAEIPKVPASQGRYRDHSLDHFTSRQLAGVRALGFEIDMDTNIDKSV